MRWLALDVGSRRVGLALCDSQEQVVTPHGSVPFSSPQDLAARVRPWVAEWGVEGVVVGVPTTRLGASRGEVRAKAVVAALRAVLAISVVEWDEAGTSKEAHQLLVQRGLSVRQRRDKVDALAASLLLERFLASRRYNSGSDMRGG
ncbi:MAG: Holliday junction resolvase RuvX [Thermoanaerobaculum sp.]|nr:Holliday junction resolvase RuvX [Thermoanaerobaculum sp.]